MEQIQNLQKPYDKCFARALLYEILTSEIFDFQIGKVMVYITENGAIRWLLSKLIKKIIFYIFEKAALQILPIVVIPVCVYACVCVCVCMCVFYGQHSWLLLCATFA